MRKSKKEKVWQYKTEEDQKHIDVLMKVRLSLVDRAYVERFLGGLNNSNEITEAQRGFIKKLLHKYRGQIK